MDKETSLHHAACVAWYKISVEQNKTIMHLSAYGLALLVVLAKDGGINCVELATAYATGIVLFSIGMVSTYLLINIGRLTIENEVINPTGIKSENHALLNGVQVVSFVVGLMCLVGIGLWSIRESFLFYST